MNSSSGSGPAPVAGTPTTATTGISVDIPYPLYGLNSGDNLAHFESDATFMSAFGQLGPSLLRYRCGKSANWFDPSTGFLLTNQSSLSASTRVTLPVKPRPGFLVQVRWRHFRKLPSWQRHVEMQKTAISVHK